jgi:hypothetical protein
MGYGALVAFTGIYSMRNGVILSYFIHRKSCFFGIQNWHRNTGGTMKKISSIILSLILLIGGVVPYASEVSAVATLLPAPLYQLKRSRLSDAS